MIITKYVVVDAPLKNSARGGAFGDTVHAFDEKALNDALQDDLAYTIFDTEAAAMNAIAESGFQADTYVVPFTIDVSEIHQVKLLLEAVFD